MTKETINLNCKRSKNILRWRSYFQEVSNDAEFEEVINKISKIDLTVMNLSRSLMSEKKDDEIENIIEKVKYDNKINELIVKHKKDFFQNPFANYSLPIITYYFSDKINELNDKNFIKNSEDLIMSIIIQVSQNIYSMTYKIMVLEVNACRENGLLVGDSSENRYKYFCETLLLDSNYLKAIYYKYIALTKLVILKTRETINYIFEIIEKTKSNIMDIENNVCQGIKLGKLTNIFIGLGDSHCQGKTVVTLNFEEKAIIYKPHSLGMVSSFYKLIEWFNSKKICDFLQLKSPKSYSIDSINGWMEMVDYNECLSFNHVRSFYIRMGQLLCILYSINATDFHFENLIACGEFPILIDLETLMRAEVLDGFEGAINKIVRILDKSVASMHFLPTHVVNGDFLYELGGLGAAKAQKNPYKSDFIINSNSDFIKVVRNYGTSLPEKNNPIIGGEIISSEKFIQDLKKGFIEVYKWIATNKDMYKRKIVELFANVECRYIPKSTSLYGRLLRSSYHPEVASSEIDRNILLRRISLSVFNKEHNFILTHEYEDLINGDIPYFYTFTNSTFLYDSKNRMVKNFKFSTSPLENAINKISDFCENDLRLQLSIIDFCYLYTKVDDLENYRQKAFKNGFEEIPLNYSIDSDSYLNVAREIGLRILERSIKGNKNGVIDRSWIGPIIIGKDEAYTNISNIGMDLYRGNSGLAFVFASLSYVTKEKVYRTAAIEALEPINAFINELYSENIKKINISVGAFNGLSGMIYSMFYTGKLLNIPSYMDKAVDFINFIFLENVEYDTVNLDFVSGLSGFLSVILSIHNSIDDKGKEQLLLKAAQAIYNDIKQNIENDSELKFGCSGYTGFGHGTSGIIASIIHLYKITKDESIIDLVKKLLNYERLLYSAKDRNWYINANKEKFSFGWCHGAPGILLSRLILKKSGYYDDCIDNEIDVAIEMTEDKGFGNNCTFCHGDLGNINILSFAAKVLDDKVLYERCNYNFSCLFKNYIEKEWNKPILGDAEVYALLVGMGGYCYSLIQQITDNTLPQVLWLD
ncbi:type 2 lantipeptide synthetase LanM [Clostridium sp. 19966]|uniref:type 2 lanthipeptide synthetase LanM family protein n=1 Tax=Clostridium sp. 19966 TaxID=2768166 RepID=UPI0028E05645|nr:type 2 lanthipeptide synthetase LanM family protein [Clostridium sp. 19966]MDT8715073.1 type 2 lantipeptide synthetase LanM [Clostridium sp. 19966]